VWEWQGSDGKEGAYTHAEARMLEEALQLLKSQVASARVDKTKLEQMLAMGFSADVSNKALLKFGNNVVMAAGAAADMAAGADVSGFNPADAAGQAAVKVKVKGIGRFVQFSPAGMFQIGPMASRDVRRDTTQGVGVKWEVLTDEGWREYDAEDAAVLERAYKQRNAHVIALDDHEVDVKDMRRRVNEREEGKVLRFVLPADRKGYAAYLSRRKSAQGAAAAVGGGGYSDGLWMWQEDDGKWFAYAKLVCKTMDACCHVEAGSSTYLVDVQTMVQTNINTRFCRNVRSVEWQRQKTGGEWKTCPHLDNSNLEEAFLLARKRHVLVSFPGGVGGCKVCVREMVFACNAAGDSRHAHAPRGAVLREDAPRPLWSYTDEVHSVVCLGVPTSL
jgi:hypothetical protein